MKVTITRRNLNRDTGSRHLQDKAQWNRTLEAISLIVRCATIHYCFTGKVHIVRRVFIFSTFILMLVIQTFKLINVKYIYFDFNTVKIKFNLMNLQSPANIVQCFMLAPWAIQLNVCFIYNKLKITNISQHLLQQ